MHRRLAKAVFYAKNLEQLCSTRADKKSLLEAEAYAAYMSGSFLLEKEKWDEALQFFAKSRLDR
jgi:signal recognition particle subunit SRP68